MVDPVTAGGLLVGGKCFGSVFLGSMLANWASDMTYELGKAGIKKLVDGAAADPDALPANHDLRNASHKSLKGAMRFALDGTAGAMGGNPLLVADIVARWRAGTLFKQPSPGPNSHEWLNTFGSAIDWKSDKFDDRIAFKDADVAQLITGSNDDGLRAFIHDQFANWVDRYVEGPRPVAFDEGLKNGWPVDGDTSARLTFFQAYCMFFREELKTNEEVFRAYLAPAVAELQLNIGKTLDSDDIIGSVRKQLGFRLGKLRELLDKRFCEVNEKLDGVTQQIEDSKDEIKEAIQKELAARGGVNAKPAIRSPSPDFEGRRTELEEFRAALNKSGVLIAGLTGQGGIGKTELAVKLADELKAAYPDGQILVELQGTSNTPKSPPRAMEDVLRALRGPTEKLPDDAAQLAQVYFAELSAKKVLLLLDNAAGREQVKPLLPPTNCGLLVTSRQYFVLAGLTPKYLAKLSPSDAKKLALRIAPRLGELAEALTQKCGYLALAVRVAASTVAERLTITPQAYLERLEKNRLAELDEVAAALKASYDLLTAKDQQFWRRLGVFPGSFDARAAATVTGEYSEIAAIDTRDALDRLHRASMVEFDERELRFELHDLARDFAFGMLQHDKKEEFTTRILHAQHYLAVLGTADDSYLSGGEGVIFGLKLFDQERVNVECAHKWAAGTLGREVAELIVHYPRGWYILNLRLHPHEMIQWWETVIRASREVGNKSEEGFAVRKVGQAFADLADVHTAIKYFEQSLEIAREIGDRRGEGASLGSLGNAYRALSEPGRAIEYYEQDLNIARELRDGRGEGMSLGNIGVAFADLGEFGQAVGYYEQGLAIARETGDSVIEGTWLVNLGIAYWVLGDTNRAIENYEHSLRIASEIGDRQGEASALCNLGNAYASMQETRKAIQYYERCLIAAREVGNRRWEAYTLGNLGEAYRVLGEADRAIEFNERELKIVREIGDRRGEAAALGNLGLINSDLGDSAGAIDYFEKRIAIAHEIGDRHGEGHALSHLADELDKIGDKPSAIETAEAAMAILESMESPSAENLRRTLDGWRRGESDSRDKLT